MTQVLTNQFISTLSDVMSVIAPYKGGTIPDVGSEEYNAWLLAIQMKYEESSRRGFWRRLLQMDDSLVIKKGDTSVLLPVQFQRANSLYIFAVDDIDYADPDRLPDGQSVFAQMITDPTDPDFGSWQLNFQVPWAADATTVICWYFATPPKPVDATDKLLLPGDLVAFGALIEIFRAANLPGSEDDARTEFENRLAVYLGMEMIPARNEILKFETNPAHIDRSRVARRQYSRRPDRLTRLQ